MSRVGYCIDNGPTESFWGIIKSEMYQMYEIIDETSLRYAINDYLRFYSEEYPQDRYEAVTPHQKCARKHCHLMHPQNTRFLKTNE